jgi:hypothetical protein
MVFCFEEPSRDPTGETPVPRGMGVSPMSDETHSKKGRIEPPAAGFFLAIEERVFKPPSPLVIGVVCLVDCQMNRGSVVIRNSMVGNGQKIWSSSLP